jgi:protein TonB
MKKILLILSLCFAFDGLYAQDTTGNHDSLFTSVQIEAMFPGGPQAWKRYLEKNLNTGLGDKYIKIPAGEKSARQTVVVSFVVDQYGNVSDVKCENEEAVHPKLAEEAIRVFKKGPKWVPAQLNGKSVPYRQRQSITWVVQA